MSPEPSGEVRGTPDGRDLVLSRSLPVSVDDGWAWITESAKLEQWFGSWVGEGRAGGRIDVTMNAEEGAPVSEGEILSCDPGHSFEVRFLDEFGNWHLTLSIDASSSATRLTFIHHLEGEAKVGQIGAGWEYYLDRLVAAIEEKVMPDFDEYWPAMGPYYEERG